MINAFAHSDETHLSKSENISHLLEVWYTAIPIYLIATAFLIVVTFYLTNKSFNKTFIISSAWLLLSGVLLYDSSPIISTIGIVLGLLSSALVSVFSITKSK